MWAEMQFNSQFRDDVSGVQQFLNASATNSTADGSDGTLGFIEDFEVTRYWLGIYGPIISGLNLILFPYINIIHSCAFIIHTNTYIHTMTCTEHA